MGGWAKQFGWELEREGRWELRRRAVAGGRWIQGRVWWKCSCQWDFQGIAEDAEAAS